MIKKLIVALLIGAASLPAAAERIRDLVTVQGVRDNALIGYGLVVGLDGSGDQTMQTPFTTQSLSNMLSQLGITVPCGHQYAAEKRRRGDGHRETAAVLACWAEYRCGGVVDG